jgi:preprotein translocase subunit YajC
MEALLPLIITFGLMWALLIRPQQRRVRQHQELVSTLAAGDEVITTGGIVGTIVAVVDDIVTLEVAPGTSIRLLRSAVQSRISPFADEVVEDEDELVEEELLEEDIDADDMTPPPSTGDKA